MHRAGAQRTTVSPRLVDQVLRPLGSDVDVSAGGERQRHFSSLLRHHFEVFSEYFVFFSTGKEKKSSDLEILRNLLSAFYLECGSSVSLISSGLTKCCSSSVSTDTLSRSLLSLFLSNIFNLDEEEKGVRTGQTVPIHHYCCFLNRL